MRLRRKSQAAIWCVLYSMRRFSYTAVWYSSSVLLWGVRCFRAMLLCFCALLLLCFCTVLLPSFCAVLLLCFYVVLLLFFCVMLLLCGASFVHLCGASSVLGQGFRNDLEETFRFSVFALSCSINDIRSSPQIFSRSTITIWNPSEISQRMKKPRYIQSTESLTIESPKQENSTLSNGPDMMKMKILGNQPKT